ncbi:hypothetical protein ACFE04_013103 [Oxalis oulophora]
MGSDYIYMHCSSKRLSIKHKVKSSIYYFGSAKSGASSPTSSPSNWSPRSPYTWLKSSAREVEIKDKRKHIFARIGNNCMGNGCRNSSTVDYKYDAISYALNFDDEQRENEELPFSLRLPRSPERSS